MKLTTRVLNAYTAFSGIEKQKNSAGRAADDFLRFGGRNSLMRQDWSQVEMSDEDMYTGYSYAAIQLRANRASALGKRFLYTDATPAMMDEAKKTGVPVEHPYLKLINKSKVFTSRKFWHDISTYLDLEGVYYLMAVRAVGTGKNGETTVGAVQSFVMLNPYNVRRVIRESDGTIGGYVESYNGMYREIPQEMIIEIRLLNPFDNDAAYSMTDAAKGSQFVLKQAEDYTRNSLHGNVNAPGIISTDVVLDDEIFDNFVSHIKNHGQGEPVYSNGASGVHWESMQIDLDKAALDKINEIHRSILFAVSGVSKTAVGIEESGTTRDTSQVQKDNFTENAVMPQMEDIIDALNLDYRRWYPEWEEDEFEIMLDNPLESDREAELKDIEIRDSELNLREELIAKGYEYEIAAKYAHGDITLEELGEPTLEPEITPQQADVMAAKEVGLPESAIPSDTTTQDTQSQSQSQAQTQAQPKNRVSATNAFVTKEQNEKTMAAARKRASAAKKLYDAEMKNKDKSPETEEVTKDEKDTTVVEDKTSTDSVEPKKETTVTVKLSNDAPKTAKNQVSAYDLPDNFFDDLEIDPRAIKDPNYRGCIMLKTENIPITQFVKGGEDDLVYSTDRHDHTMGAVGEVAPHTTLFYGLLNNGNVWKNQVDQLLIGWSTDTVKINEVSFFDLPDSYAIVGLLDASSELLDAHGRLSLLPNINTFSEYHPHITLAYINKDADVEKWVKALGKKYNGQIVSTKGIDYGDMPEESDDDGEGGDSLKDDTPAQANNSSVHAVEASHSHDCSEHGFIVNSTMEKANNELNPEVKDQVILQEANLQSAVARLDADIQAAVVEALKNGDIKEANRLIPQQEEDGFIAQLAVILAAYYTVLFPIYAAQLFAARLSTFGQQGVFSMTDDIEEFIKDTANKAAESHVSTVLSDLGKSYDIAQASVVRDELIKEVQDRVNARDEEYLKNLPDNPNPEDIVKAVDAGKFDATPAYKKAQEMALSGASLAQTQRALQDAYADISKGRAKTIAQNEASRVFNMSQYEADLIFLTETNNLDNAYKRLRSRTGNPCAVCSKLIKATTLHPIPFKSNFASLGEEITASYRKPNGKMAIQKVPINYEAIKAGNIHVNCNCEYELVIKRNDGTVINDARVSGHYTDNKFNPLQPRDKDGKWTDGNVAGRTSHLPSLKFSGMSPDEFSKSIKEQYSGEDWTQEEASAVKAYTSSQYRDINRYLREPRTDNRMRQVVNNLDHSMKNRLKEDTDLFRGISTTQEFNPGTIIETSGYNSSSFNYETAVDFAKDGALHSTDGRAPIVMRIKAKKGQKGVIPILVNDDKPLRAVEAEYILPRNLKFKVNDVQDKGDYEEVTVEVVNG